MTTPDPVTRKAKAPLTHEMSNPKPGNFRFLPSLLKRATKPTKTMTMTAMAMFLAGAAQAASVFFSPTNAPPSLGSLSISNLYNPYLSPAHGSDFGSGSNVGQGGNGGGSDGSYTYI